MFTSRQRAIYVYSVGDRKRYADPLRCLRLMTEALGGQPNHVLDRAKDKSLVVEDRLKYQGQLVSASRHAFQLEELDSVTGRGVTDEEALQLLRSFLGWINSKKVKAGNGVIGSRPMDSLPASVSPTPSLSPSISTWNGPASGPLGIWPEDQESPEA